MRNDTPAYTFRERLSAKVGLELSLDRVVMLRQLLQVLNIQPSSWVGTPGKSQQLVSIARSIFDMS